MAGILIAISLTSCSGIQFYDKYHGPDNITKVDIAGQIENIKRSDPVVDSTIAHLFFDNRFVSVAGVGQTFYGLNTEDLGVLDSGSKAIWGTTDVGPNDTLLALAADYSYKYNSNLLDLRNMASLKKPLDDREKQYIEHFKK